MIYDMSCSPLSCARVVILDRERVRRQNHHIIQGSWTNGVAVETEESTACKPLDSQLSEVVNDRERRKVSEGRGVGVGTIVTKEGT